MTKQITQVEPMTEGQQKRIKDLIDPVLGTIDFSSLGISKEGAQEIIEKGNLLQSDIKDSIIDALMKYAIIDKRFGAAIAEFELTVPPDYNQDTQIDEFGKKTKKLKTTYYYNDALTSKNFAKATNKLTPGKTYKVKIFPILSTVTSEDCMNFLRKQNAILVGGQGVTLAQDLKADEFPIGKYTVSFDEKEALWKDSAGDHRVPRVGRGSDGGWEFRLGSFGIGWGVDGCLLCFCDL